MEKDATRLDLVDYDEVDKERLINLTQKLEKCKEECEQIKKEKKDLDDFLIKKTIDGVTLSTDKKLIDLLKERILDFSPKWRENLDTLINRPTSLKDDTKKYLRGGDYFEALFQLAIATGILPEFKNKFVRFYDIDKNYTAMELKHNYLYNKSIKKNPIWLKSNSIF